MRLALLLILLLPSTAHAWTFTSGLPCRLTHETEQARIELTYDPNQPLYSVTITRQMPWPDAPSFSMRFDGPMPLVIGTDRHVLSAGGTALSVSDSGFGNVLNGLQYNRSATVLAGEVELTFPLDGAAQQVAAFRACKGAPLAS
jgi:hypothetical protein